MTGRKIAVIGGGVSGLTAAHILARTDEVTVFEVSPLLMTTFILVKGTGQRMTERRMSGNRPGYASYVERTSGFIPLPPRPPGRPGRTRRPRSAP